VHANTEQILTQDQIKTADEFLEEVKTRIKSKMPNPEKEHRELIKKKAVLEKLSVKKVLFNATLGINKDLKAKIHTLRREILFAKDSIEAQKTEIEDLKKRALAAHKISSVQGRTADENNNKILAMKKVQEDSIR